MTATLVLCILLCYMKEYVCSLIPNAKNGLYDPYHSCLTFFFLTKLFEQNSNSVTVTGRFYRHLKSGKSQMGRQETVCTLQHIPTKLLYSNRLPVVSSAYHKILVNKDPCMKATENGTMHIYLQVNHYPSVI